jgi:CDP-paratose 2-epimerase
VIGGGEEAMISLLESIKLIESISGKKAIVNFEKERFGDLRYFVTDYKKFNKATGWKPKVTPQKGIAELVKWVERNESRFKH